MGQSNAGGCPHTDVGVPCRLGDTFFHETSVNYLMSARPPAQEPPSPLLQTAPLATGNFFFFVCGYLFKKHVSVNRAVLESL